MHRTVNQKTALQRIAHQKTALQRIVLQKIVPATAQIADSK